MMMCASARLEDAISITDSAERSGTIGRQECDLNASGRRYLVWSHIATE
ncbi:MAG: hypothetical protein MJZ99_04910 [Bacteroidales bacterium]|nr:hypothetical protein [Bacteroidales bacterium]